VAAKEHEAALKKQKKRKPKIPMPKTHDQLISPPDSIGDSSQQNLLSIIQTFSATTSPFVYLSTPPQEQEQGDDDDNDENQNQNDASSDNPPEEERFWERPALVRRNRPTQFVPIRPVDFGNQLPNSDKIAEIAFLGRSNVGKSSLLNSVMMEKLCRTSKQPGRTQQVSYYGMMTEAPTKPLDWRRARGFLVDLPGYGYAVGPNKLVDDWQKRTQDFLLDRMEAGNLRRLYLLVDARHLQQTMDLSILKWLDEVAIYLPYTIVLTKADAIRGGPPALMPLLNSLSMRYQHGQFQQGLQHDDDDNDIDSLLEMPTNALQPEGALAANQSPVIHVTSSSKNIGIDDLWKSICFEFQQGPLRLNSKNWNE